MTILHFKTQSDQPYGSQRRCCNMCGMMLWNQPGEPPWTDDADAYDMSPDRCIAKPETERYAPTTEDDHGQR